MPLGWYLPLGNSHINFVFFLVAYYLPWPHVCYLCPHLIQPNTSGPRLTCPRCSSQVWHEAFGCTWSTIGRKPCLRHHSIFGMKIRRRDRLMTCIVPWSRLECQARGHRHRLILPCPLTTVSLFSLQTPNRPIHTICKLSALSPPSLTPFSSLCRVRFKRCGLSGGKRVASCCCATTALLSGHGARHSTFEGLGMHQQNKSGCVHAPVFRRDEVPRHSSRF